MPVKQRFMRTLITSGECDCDCPKVKTSCCKKCLPYCLLVSITGWGTGYAYPRGISEDGGSFDYWEAHVGGACEDYDQYARFIRVRIRCTCDEGCAVFLDGEKCPSSSSSSSSSGLGDPLPVPQCNCGFELELSTTYQMVSDSVLCTDWHFEQVADTYDSGWVCPAPADQACDDAEAMSVFRLTHDFTSVPVLGTATVEVTKPDADHDCCNDEGCCVEDLPDTLYLTIDFSGSTVEIPLYAAEFGRWSSVAPDPFDEWHIACEGVLSGTDPGINIIGATVCCREGTWFLSFENDTSCVGFACARPASGNCSPLDLSFVGYFTTGTDADCCGGTLAAPGVYQNWVGSITE